MWVLRNGLSHGLAFGLHDRSVRPPLSVFRIFKPPNCRSRIQIAALTFQTLTPSRISNAPMALKLEMIQGPREGETFGYPPGSTIRIGRVVRGNNLAFKDPGISSKHLVIECKSEGKWTVKDLDSSNGTTLNSATKLTPFEPLDLRDGDIVKLGEFTSLLVRIISENVEASSQVQRATRSRAAKKPAPAVEEKSEWVNGDAEIVEVSGDNRRRGRPPRGRASEKKAQIEVETSSQVRRTTRSQAAKNTVPAVEEKSDLVSGDVEIVDNRRRGRPRKGRVLEKIPEVETVPETSGPTEENAVLRTLNSRSNGSVGGNGRGGKGRRNNVQESPLENEEVVTELEKNTEEEDEKYKGKFKLVEIKKEIEEYEEGENYSDVKQNSDGECRVNESVDLEKRKEDDLDLETITLAELFDYLEVALPREIKDASARCIEEMRKKAMRIQEYMMQSKIS